MVSTVFPPIPGPLLTDGIDVWGQRAEGAAPVLLDGLWRVQLREVIVGVHCYQDVGYKRLVGGENNRKNNGS